MQRSLLCSSRLISKSSITNKLLRCGSYCETRYIILSSNPVAKRTNGCISVSLLVLWCTIHLEIAFCSDKGFLDGSDFCLDLHHPFFVRTQSLVSKYL